MQTVAVLCFLSTKVDFFIQTGKINLKPLTPNTCILESYEQSHQLNTYSVEYNRNKLMNKNWNKLQMPNKSFIKTPILTWECHKSKFQTQKLPAPEKKKKKKSQNTKNELLWSHF